MKKYNKEEYWNELIEGCKCERKCGIISKWVVYILIVGLVLVVMVSINK